MAELLEKLDVPSEFSMAERLYRPTPLIGWEERLAELGLQARADAELLRYPTESLPYSPREDVLEGAVVGAGRTGKAVGFGLERYGFRNFRIFDRRPRGLQGPWRTYARNHLLRSRKSETGGLHWGIPSLHFQRWCDAK